MTIYQFGNNIGFFSSFSDQSSKNIFGFMKSFCNGINIHFSSSIPANIYIGPWYQYETHHIFNFMLECWFGFRVFHIISWFHQLQNVINQEHISTLLYNASPTLKQPREYPCPNVMANCKSKMPQTRSSFALLQNASPTRTHKSIATEISKVMTNCPKKMCKLEIPLLYSRVDHKHIMLMSTNNGTSILLQNACTINT